MKQFNITAQVYRLHDPYKQTLLINQIEITKSSDEAVQKFKSKLVDYHLIKIYSIEEIV